MDEIPFRDAVTSEEALRAIVGRPSELAIRKEISYLDAHCRAAAAEIGNGSFDLLLTHGSALVAIPPIGRFVDLPKVLYLQEPERSMYEAATSWPWIPPRSSSPGRRWHSGSPT